MARDNAYMNGSAPSYLKWENKQPNGGMIWKTGHWLIRKYNYPEPSYSIGMRMNNNEKV